MASHEVPPAACIGAQQWRIDEWSLIRNNSRNNPGETSSPSKFATASAEARNLYQEAYTAELAYKRAANDGSDEAAALKAEYETKERAYEDFVAPLAAKAAQGQLDLGAAVGPELWLDFQVQRQGKTIPLRLNLNTTDARWLKVAGFDADAAEKIIEARDGAGFISDLRQLRRSVPQAMPLIEEAHRRFEGSRQK